MTYHANIPSPLAGLGGIGSSLADVLEKRAERGRQKEFLQEQQDYQENLAESQRQRQEAAQIDQQSALNVATQKATQTEGSIWDQLSAFQEGIAESGVAIDPQTTLGYVKNLSDIYAKQQKGSERTTEDRQTLKGNQTILTGLHSDAKVAHELNKDIDNIRDAITSGKTSGPGAPGMIKRGIRSLFGKGQPAEEQALDTYRKNFLLKLGDTKGIRLTDTKLRFLEESLFNPKKSKEANLEALKIVEETLNERIAYPQLVKQLLTEDEEALYDPSFTIRLEDAYNESKGRAQPIQERGGGQLTPQSFAERVRARGKKK